MKILSTVSRYLLGLFFAFSGLNGLFHFVPQPPPTNPVAQQFFQSVSVSHFSAFFFTVQALSGLLLLSGFYVPLAVILLAAEVFNILAYHVTMDPKGAGPGVVAALLLLLVFWQYRTSFSGVLSAKPNKLR